MSSLSLTTSPANTLPPLLRLASELHLAIISFLPGLKDAKDIHDLALLQLRRTNRYFRSLVSPPTHDDLLSLELALFKYSLYACKFCLCLQSKTKFASAMLKGKTGANGTARNRRFCAECGFDTTMVGLSQRYCPGARACVNGSDWVWCKNCKFVKKWEEAKSQCVGLCKECHDTLGCRCGLQCDRLLQSTTPLYPRAARTPRNMLRLHASDADSDEDDRTDKYEFWEEQLWLAQQEDDDWRTL